MKINFSHFNVAARNVVVIANTIKTLRRKQDIDDVDLAIAASAVESPAIDNIKQLGISFSSLCKQLKIDVNELRLNLQVKTKLGNPFTSELLVPELDDYEDFTPSGRFIIHWLSNLALNTAIRNSRESNKDSFPLGDPSDLTVKPEHILFVALSNRGAAPSKLIEAVYHGADLDPAKTLRERLGFKSYDITH